MHPDKTKKLLAAKPDVDAVIRKHGFDAVRYVMNKRAQENSLRKQLAREKKELEERIAAIQSKLKR